MRDAFKIVRGAVSTKDLVPVLTHFALHNGRLHGYNGRVHISAPVKDLASLPSFTAPATRLMAAIDGAGEEDPRLEIVDKVLKIIAKRYRAQVPTGPIEDFPLIEVAEKRQKIRKGLLPALAALRPFIGEDASRPWCSSVKVQGAIALATNNSILAEVSLPFVFPMEGALPVFAIDELLRIGEEPIALSYDDVSITFYLPGDVFVRSQLLAEGWPDAKAVLKAAHDGAKLKLIPADLASAIQRVKPLSADDKHPRIRLAEGEVATLTGDSQGVVSGFKDIGNGTYYADVLLQVLEVATRIDWSRFPRVPWEGDGISGVMLGLPS